MTSVPVNLVGLENHARPLTVGTSDNAPPKESVFPQIIATAMMVLREQTAVNPWQRIFPLLS